MNDFRYALRTLRNSPGFTLTVTLLLALGIGASCVIFGALDAVMLKRLPVRDPEQLFRVVTNRPQLGKRSDMTRADFQAFRERATCATDVFGFQEEFAGRHRARPRRADPRAPGHSELFQRAGNRCRHRASSGAG